MDRVRGNRFIWFDHILRKVVSKAVKPVINMNVKRRREMKKTLNAFECDIGTAGMWVDKVYNKIN